MTSINQIGINTVSNNDKINKESPSLFLISSNPVLDAAGWGAGGVVGGAICGVISQKQSFKNPEKLANYIKGIKETIEKNLNNPKKIKALEKTLENFKNKKIDIRALKPWVIGMGLITFVPQLFFNLIAWLGKKGYDKLKGNN